MLRSHTFPLRSRSRVRVHVNLTTRSDRGKKLELAGKPLFHLGSLELFLRPCSFIVPVFLARAFAYPSWSTGQTWPLRVAKEQLGTQTLIEARNTRMQQSTLGHLNLFAHSIEDDITC